MNKKELKIHKGAEKREDDLTCYIEALCDILMKRTGIVTTVMTIEFDEEEKCHRMTNCESIVRSELKE